MTTTPSVKSTQRAKRWILYLIFALALICGSSARAQGIGGSAGIGGRAGIGGGRQRTAPAVTGNVCTSRGFGGPTYTCTFGSSLGSGSILVFQFGYVGPFVSVSGCGATWTTTSIDGVSSSTYGTGASSGSCTVTLTAAAGYGEMYGIEVSGSSGVDVTAAQTCLDASGNPSGTCSTNIAAGTTMSAPAVTTTLDHDLVIALYNNDGVTGPTFTQGAGYTNQGQSSDLFIETKVAVTAGSNTPTATSNATSSSFDAGTIALKGT